MIQKPSRLGIKHLRYALAVADAGGFRAASDLLNIAQPAISKSVQDTEQDLGITIFQRPPKPFAVTEPGTQFLADARQAVALFERTIRATRRNSLGRHGHVIIGYSALAPSSEISEGLQLFSKVCPDVQVEMHVMSTDAITSALKSGTIDLGFVLSHTSVAKTNLDEATLWSCKIGFVAPIETDIPDFKTACSFPFILGVRENWRSFRNLIDEACELTGFQPHVVEEPWDVQVIFQRVSQKRGLTLYPSSIRESLPASLKLLTFDEFCPQLDVAMVWDKAANTQLLHKLVASFRSDTSIDQNR